MDRVNEVTRDVLSTVGQLRSIEEASLGEPAALHTQLRSLITNAMRTASTLGFAQHDVQDIGYALTALVDEVIMLKGGTLRDFWAAHMLQLELFNEATAGQGLFDRVNVLLSDPSRVEVLQVYYLTLLFGFQGKYRVRGGEIELGDVTDRVRDAIRRSGAHKETELSPHGQRPDSRAEGVRSNRSLIWAALGVLGVALTVYIGMAWSLSSKVDGMSEQFEALSAEVD
ncbi:MAG: DotU family type IV/VI secretion system protein [Myxococcota bacterium]